MNLIVSYAIENISVYLFIFFGGGGGYSSWSVNVIVSWAVEHKHVYL